jgi:hypothetical protein
MVGYMSVEVHVLFWTDTTDCWQDWEGQKVVSCEVAVGKYSHNLRVTEQKMSLCMPWHHDRRGWGVSGSGKWVFSHAYTYPGHSPELSGQTRALIALTFGEKFRYTCPLRGWASIKASCCGQESDYDPYVIQTGKQYCFQGFINPVKFKTWLYVPPALTHKNFTFCPQCVYVLFVDLTTNSDYFSLQH